MPPNDKAGRVVFIGNIPYGGTEELIVETLSRVGHVLNFRLVYDKETGRPKGFGFAEFADADAAASAVRNLNDFDLMGRKLRVDWSNDNGAGDNATATNNNYSAPPVAPPNMNGQPVLEPSAQTATLPPLPPGQDLAPNLTCPDAISRTLSTLPAPQLLDILSQMKGLVTTDPAKATELLRQAPQLAYAIFQSLLLLNLVDTSVLGSLVEQTPGPAAAPAPPVQPPATAASRYGAYPPQAVPTPPNPGYAQPPPPVQHQQPPMQPPPALPTDPQQLAMIQQLMAMPQAQIDALPPEHRATIMATVNAYRPHFPQYAR